MTLCRMYSGTNAIKLFFGCGLIFPDKKIISEDNLKIIIDKQKRIS